MQQKSYSTSTNSRKKKRLRKKRTTVGLPPGQLIYTGTIDDQAAEISIIEYSPEHYREQFNIDINQKQLIPTNDQILWVNLNALSNTNLIKRLQDDLGLNQLAVEDSLHIGQRSKFDAFKEHCSFITHIMHLDHVRGKIHSEQVAIFWGRNFVVTLQEKEEDVLKIIRERLKNNLGRIRHLGPDYLAYAVIDAIVDHNTALLESFEEYVELLEERLADANGDDFEEIFQIRNTILQFRRLTTPIRDALQSLIHSNSPFTQAATKVYFQDVHDHALSLADNIQSIREDITTYTELRLALLSHKSNATIHLLTIVSTIFIPLTFLSSIYGMNFDNMPELHHPAGYFILWCIMALLVIAQLFYFRRKNWF